MHTSTEITRATITPAGALQLLEDGNKRFVDGKAFDRDLLQQVRETGGGQWPVAAILGCIDSRVPAEMIFDQGIGDIFNVRVAGNIANVDILGSLEFGCKVAGARLIVVLGHSRCGAVRGACDDVQLGNLSALLGKIKPAIDVTPAPDGGGARDSSNPEFLQDVAKSNVRLTRSNILEQSSVLREMHDAGEIDVVGAMYDVATGRVEFQSYPEA